MEWNEIRGNIFDHVQVKTGIAVQVELNDIALEILRKYSGSQKILKSSNPLPVLTINKMGEYIKEVCQIVGIDDTIKKTIYKENKEFISEKKKWELVSTHTARRSFITNSLIAGKNIPLVMSESGHKSLGSFQKYIDLSNQSIRESKSKKSQLRVVK